MVMFRRLGLIVLGIAIGVVGAQLLPPKQSGKSDLTSVGLKEVRARIDGFKEVARTAPNRR